MRQWPLIALVLVSCSKKPTNTEEPLPPGVSPTNHPFFPIAEGTTHAFGKDTVNGPITCDSCHRSTADSFASVRCDHCHKHSQAITERLHLGEPKFPIDTSSEPDPEKQAELRGAHCVSCHPTGEKVAFTHARLSDGCAMCHASSTAFAALPRKDGMPHPEIGTSDCSSCHHDVTTWKGADGAPGGLSSLPDNDLTVTGLVPTYFNGEISALMPLPQTLSMTMDHASRDVPATASSACSNCHPAPGAPGNFHSSLSNLTLMQPTRCTSCHASARPIGFVGPTATSPPRLPPSPEMKHDAVAWVNGAPGTMPLVTADCGICHAPTGTQELSLWQTSRSGTKPTRFHAALADASLPQPTSCIDCHANTRPVGVLTSSNSSLPASLSFDHSAPVAKGDCVSCHARSAQAPFTSWSQGVFHAVGSSTPTSCGACHEGERPTSTTGWLNTSYQTAPFDYGSPTRSHGAGQDCVLCHANPGTGQWGAGHNWAAGRFTHAGSPLIVTCISCHSTQRPDLVIGGPQANTLLSFDHRNATGDCAGCHQATVTANTYAHYFNATTNALPNGDWKGGVPYPGSSFAASATQSISVTELKLVRSGANNLVTSMSSTNHQLFNGMLHISASVPAALNAGPTGNPDSAKCWHCHTPSSGTTVTNFSDGKFHTSLTSYRATPGSPVMAFPQPTTGCADCHAAGLPLDIVQRNRNSLLSMDHAAQFTQAVMLGGKSVSAVRDADCSVCHKAPGASWNDGVFHANIGSAQPRECVSCHYPVMADAPKSDVTNGTHFAMKHASTQLTSQACETCHPAALGHALMMPVAATSWATGELHPRVTPQPTRCNDCHLPSNPATLPPPNATQSTVTWTFALGGTATNGAMWMNHGSAFVVGRDCAVCHQADAKTMGSAWSKSDPFHDSLERLMPRVTVTTCAGCHGLTNGRGGTTGTNNNLPSGLTNATLVTSASAATGVAGQRSQITHVDANVLGRDCAFCHSVPSVGPWTAAKFHQNFNATNPLTLNGTTARCSNCHLNVKPTAAYTMQDHSTFTSAPGSQDCSSCHSWPGTGNATAPNWLGATGSPQFIAVGGFSIGAPPAATAGAMQVGIMSLPHPSTSAGACTSCHTSSGGGKNALGYDHGSALIATNCNACHEAGSNLVGTVWNGATATASGAGDTRPFTLTSLVAHFGNGLTVNAPRHFYPVDCNQCHVVPMGNGAITTGTAYTAAWAFPHNQARMTNPTTCVMCHVNGVPGAPDGGVADPAHDVTVTSQVPTFVGKSIASVAPHSQTLSMTMVHSSTEYPAAANGACSNCHETASAGLYFPGAFHSSLANLALAQPTACASCHDDAAPTGFVGATLSTRSPPSAEMRHEATRWTNGVRTTTALVSANCGQCHAPPSARLAATWATSADGGAVKYHPSLATQPVSCLDCHANSRPTATLTSANATLPMGVSFDHQTTAALDDCAGCHARSTLAPWSSWTQGRYHLAGATNPTTCLPCHQGERPTSTTGWASTTYSQAPFDYGTNAAGITHGNGLDCAGCHPGPGTGAWGSTQNWQNGRFTHAPASAIAACVNCHSTQRPDLVIGVSAANTALNFDHAVNGTGDCAGCHQASIVAGTYARYFNASTGTLPNGDWKGGQAYPGSSLVSSAQFITVTQTRLVKTGALVTGTTNSSNTLFNAMLHVSAALPAALNAGPTGTPDSTKCWHCHTHAANSTTVTSFSNGKYHSALTTYSATPGGTVVPFPQPTARCTDCHSAMLPDDIVQRAGSNLQPMDHSARFVSAVTLGGASVTSVDQADCSVCHKTPGTSWNDGLFHANIGAATPADCVQCHYPLMADATKSDLTMGTSTMKHRSALITSQACTSCHATALARAATASHAANLWATGTMHPSVSPQPTSCLECHSTATPASATQSTVAYTLALGGTATNGGQWMNHAFSNVVGRDCVVCHAADAKTSGSAWSRSALYHPASPGLTACATCHGTTNGKGTVIGTNNNLPTGLTNSTTVSASAGAANTGIPAGAKAQITHSDVNVTSHDCAFCHVQQGVSAVPAIQGKEWAQASFHSHFTGGTVLVLNGTTGRCSNCHLSEKPGAAYPRDHSGFTATSAQDCNSCHSWPGTGTASTANWLGAAGVPQYLTVGGFQVSRPPATAVTTQTGINLLPHPTSTACTSCHSSASGGKSAIGYDHASTLIATNCNSCHEAGSNLVSPVWNGATTAAAGAGDTRPFTATAIAATFSGNTCNFTNPNHFYPVDCKECHLTPTGIVVGTTGTTYRNTRWKFQHTKSKMTNPSTCRICHGPCPD